MMSHRLVGGDVLGMHVLSFFDQGLLDLRNWPHPHAVKLFGHAPNGPEQIDCSGTGLTDGLAYLVEVFLQFADIFGL